MKLVIFFFSFFVFCISLICVFLQKRKTFRLRLRPHAAALSLFPIHISAARLTPQRRLMPVVSANCCLQCNILFCTCKVLSLVYITLLTFSPSTRQDVTFLIPYLSNCRNFMFLHRFTYILFLYYSSFFFFFLCSFFLFFFLHIFMCAPYVFPLQLAYAMYNFIFIFFCFCTSLCGHFYFYFFSFVFLCIALHTYIHFFMHSFMYLFYVFFLFFYEYLYFFV